MGLQDAVEFVKFRNTMAIVVVVAGIVILFFFPQTYLPLATGLSILWGEMALGIAASITAHLLTLRAVAMKGVEIEQNPYTKRMLQRENFHMLWGFYALMVAAGVFLTMTSINQGGVWMGVLVLLLAFPVLTLYDVLNDVVWLRRFENENQSPESVSFKQ